MQEQEIWKDVIGYEGLYQVSNFGRVKSIRKNKVMILSYDRGLRYLDVILRKDGNIKHFSVHRLVAQTFIPNPNNLPQVNHIDENKTNNHADNLEWCTASQNMRHGTAMTRAIRTRFSRHDVKDIVKKVKASKISNQSYSAEIPVNQFSIDGSFIKRYVSSEDARRQTHINHIGRCCQGKQRTAGGFIWLYDKDVDEISKRAFPPSPNSKKINQYDLQGNFIKTWNSATEAHETIGVNISSLSECCNGKRKKAMGFIWKFKD